MKAKKLFVLAVIITALSFTATAQNKTLLKRTTYKTDRLDFGVGGIVSVVGAPIGSIRIEGWSNREIEISAEIEVQAATESDLVKLSEVTTFVTDESLGRTSIISVGTHEKQYVKRLGKKLPKNLQSMPFRIDYVIKVPRYSDLQIDGGTGDLHVSGVEGTMRVNFLETNAKIELVGGATTATFGRGEVEIIISTASWRGRYTDMQLANGTMTVRLPRSLNAEFDAAILRTGKIENGYAEFKPRVRKGEFTDRSIAAKSGVGGSPLKFTVGDGTLRIVEANRPT